jgi:flagellar biosynthesis/type III secretory pathway protein FliH
MLKSIAQEIEELEAKKNEAFQALMKLIAPANQDEAITQFVKATHNAWSIGFKDGYEKGKDFLTCAGCGANLGAEYNHYC